MKYLTTITILLALCGCAKKQDPITNINDGIQQGAHELIDYANNNMVIDADKQLLLNGVKDCAEKANALTQTCSARIEACNAETSKARAERNTLAVILILLVAIKLFNIRV